MAAMTKKEIINESKRLVQSIKDKVADQDDSDAVESLNKDIADYVLDLQDWGDTIQRAILVIESAISQCCYRGTPKDLERLQEMNVNITKVLAVY